MNLKLSLGRVAALLALVMVSISASIAFAAITSLTLSAPNGGEMWSGTQDITWTHTDGLLGDLVSVVLSTDSGASYSTVIASNVEVTDLLYSWDTNNTAAGPLADGSTYRVRVTDGATSIDVSSSDFTVDNTAPTLTVVDGTEPGPVMTDTINITTADATSGVASQEYGFSTDNVCDASDTYGNAFTSGVSFPIAGDNTDFLCAKATDNAGNIGYELVGQLNTDNTAPSVLSYTLDGGTVDAYFNPSSDTVAIEITADESVTWTTVRVQDDFAASIERTYSPGVPGTTISMSWDGSVSTGGPLQDGAYELFYTIEDLAGNITGPLAGPLGTHQIIVDTVDPTMTSVVATTVQGGGDTIEITFSEDVVATDGDWTNGGEVTIESPLGAPVDLTTATSAFSANVLTITLDEATDMAWLKNLDDLRVTPVAGAIKDLADNEVATTQDDASIDGDIVVPTVALSYDINRQVKDADTIVITATFSEEMDNTPQIAIATLGDGSLTATNMTIGADRTEWTYSWDVPAGSDDDGTATITITGEDLAGNTMTDATNTRVIDNTDPTVDTFTKPVANTVYTADTLLTFTASDTGTGTGPVCTYSLNGGADVATTCTETDLSVASLNEGRNTLEVTVTDEAGNTVSDGPVSFIYDTDGILTVGTVPTQDFDFIQEANDAWVSGITDISVTDGTYIETATIDQALTVSSVNGSGSTFIEGSITVDADGVTIDGFDVSNPAGSFGVIVNGNSNVVVENNNINNIGTTLALGSAQGIYLNGGSTNPANIDFSNNTISNIGNTSMAHNGGAGSSAKGIYVGTTSGTGTITGLTITDNTISNIYASTAAWAGWPSYGGGAGANGIMINFGGTTTATISGNTITTLEGLWSHAIGLEGDTPNTSVTGNTISDLIDYKGSTDAVAVFAQSNPSISTVNVNNNMFDASNTPIGVALHPTLAATTAGVLDATGNWWGDATGPYSATSNSTGLGSAVWPSVDDGENSHVDFSPFYNSAAMTLLVSVDPIASFDLDFNPDPQAVNNPVALTVTARDALGYLVVNDSTTQVKLDADSGASFGATPVTMEADGDVATTINNTIIGTVNVTAEEWPGGPATGVGTVEFIAGSDVTAPAISNIQSTAITTTGVTITWDTDEASSSQVEYGTTSGYGTLTVVDAAMVTAHSVTITGLTEGTDYHFRVISLDASSNVGTSGDNTFTTVAVDTTPPTITLLGQNPVTLETGNAYAEPGATANDNVDGDITGSIVIDASAVNTAVAGTYTVTYNVSDAAANAAVQETRTVIVTDPAVTPIVPTVTLSGAAILSSYTVTEATARFASGLQFNTTDAASVTVNGSSVTPGATVTAVSQANAITVGSHTYNVIVTSSTGDTDNITVAYQVTADPTADTTAPVITLLGVNPLTLTVGDSYAEPGATANDNVDGDITGSIVIDASAVNTAVAGTYTVTYNVSDAAANAAVQETRTVIVNAAFDDTATLAVTGIDAVKTYATADDTYANGWSWKYHVTVPTGETDFQMKFSDFISGANSIAAANNIRFYTAQASANADGANAVTITAADTYSTVITLDSDLEAGTAGRQIEVIVEMKVPTGSAGGSYSGSYGVQSN